ncbi:TetR/AcrR family transcriptional regulator [Wandonia haliotis]|uniref:TetR/AcrR family transcriptional regulator n=1 Tax=Wandonia haliotis TaxID=574963 RepID=A0ABP3Y5V1_9FLAO
MEEKREEILLKATQVYTRYGIRSVTMDDLARELSVSKKTIYNYFKDKDEIVQEIIKTKLEADRFNCGLNESTAKNAIEELLGISQFVADMVKNVHPSVFYDLQKYHPKAWELLNTHKWEFLFGQILKNIKRGIDEGLYRDNMNPDLVARLHLAKSDLVFGGEFFPIDQSNIEEIFTELFRLQIRGMASEKGLEYLKQRLNNQENA